MSKTTKGCLAAAGFSAALLGILFSVARSREANAPEYPPLTLQDLAEVAAAIEEPPPADSSEAGNGETTGDTAAKKELPRRLNRAPTDAERREHIDGIIKGARTSDRMFQFVLRSPLGPVADTAAVVSGLPDSGSWTCGYIGLLRHDYGKAKMCYEQVVRESDNAVKRRRACAMLAWLEDDPEMAARYMEIACSTGRVECLIPAVELAMTTESEELWLHYAQEMHCVEETGRP